MLMVISFIVPTGWLQKCIFIIMLMIVIKMSNCCFLPVSFTTLLSWTFKQKISINTLSIQNILFSFFFLHVLTILLISYFCTVRPVGAILCCIAFAMVLWANSIFSSKLQKIFHLNVKKPTFTFFYTKLLSDLYWKKRKWKKSWHSNWADFFNWAELLCGTLASEEVHSLNPRMAIV